MPIIANQYIRIGGAPKGEKPDAIFGTGTSAVGSYTVYVQIGGGLATSEINKVQSQIGHFVELHDYYLSEVGRDYATGTQNLGLPWGGGGVVLSPDPLTFEGVIQGVGNLTRRGLTHYYEVTFKSLCELWLELGKTN